MIIEQKNTGKSTYYIPTSFFLSTLADKDPTLVDKDPTLVDKDPTLVDKDPIEEIRAQLPKRISELIDSIGSRSQNKGLIPDTIIQLCSWRDLSIADLAALLNRNEKYIKTQYIQPLIEANKIAYTIPAMISHPNQKYRAENLTQ